MPDKIHVIDFNEFVKTYRKFLINAYLVSEWEYELSIDQIAELFMEGICGK